MKIWQVIQDRHGDTPYHKKIISAADLLDCSGRDVSGAEYTLLQIEVENQLRNYIYILQYKNTVFAVDVCDAEQVITTLNIANWKLDYILTTHHHFDHMGGNEELQQKTGCKIIANAKDDHGVIKYDIAASADRSLTVPSGDSDNSSSTLDIDVIGLDGHTIGHVAYYFPELKMLFSGDVIFSMGCGRIFEGTMAQGLESLKKIAALPDDVMICAAHEYSYDGAKFALNLEPDNGDIQRRAEQVRTLRLKYRPTVPTTVALEKNTNPFLRCREEAIHKAIGLDSEEFGSKYQELNVFAIIRDLRSKS